MKNKQHLIALDLDGTLLTGNKEIDPRTRETILRAVEDGHIIVIATGRPHRSSIPYYHTLGLDTPMVNFNGALIHHPHDNKWEVLHNPLPKRTALHIVETCYQLGVPNIMAEVQDKVYLDKFDQQLIDLFKTTEEEPLFTIGSLQSKLTTDPTSLLIHPEENHIQSLRDHLDEHHAEVTEHRNWGAPWNIIEIVKKGMNKAVGLHKIAHYFHIPKERIVAFGDEDNDLEMIDYAGVGVAMDNAIDELKTVANHVTDSNEQNGIGKFLENYLQLNVKTD